MGYNRKDACRLTCPEKASMLYLSFVRSCLVCPEVPQPGGLVLGAGDEVVAAGVEAGRVDVGLVAPEHLLAPVSAQVPQADRPEGERGEGRDRSGNFWGQTQSYELSQLTVHLLSIRTYS